MNEAEHARQNASESFRVLSGLSWLTQASELDGGSLLCMTSSQGLGSDGTKLRDIPIHQIGSL